MIIRKEFRVESAHVVRNCTSHRCSHSIHGHSAVIELFLKGYQLDNAGMLYDFGLMKGTIKEFIDSMDHCYLLCKYDSLDFIKFIQENCDRWIMLPFNPSAEMLSMFVHRFAQKIIDHTKTNNGEGVIEIDGVAYHETTTGYARSDEKDMRYLWKEMWDIDVCFSKGVIKDWSKDLKKVIFDNEDIENPKIKQQIKIGGKE